MKTEKEEMEWKDLEQEHSEKIAIGTTLKVVFTMFSKRLISDDPTEDSV